MKEAKNNNISMKVISVVIAVLIWLLVANINDPVRTERFTDVPVKIINEQALTDLGYAYEVTEGSEVTIIARERAVFFGICPNRILRWWQISPNCLKSMQFRSM